MSLHDEIVNCKCFLEFSEADFSTLDSFSESIDLAPGDCLIQQGSMPDYFYVLQSGSLEVSERDIVHDEKMVHAVLDQAGAFVGEVSLIDDQPRSADVHVKTAAQLLKIDIKKFKDTALHNEAFSHIMIQASINMSARLRSENEKRLNLFRSHLSLSSFMFSIMLLICLFILFFPLLLTLMKKINSTYIGAGIFIFFALYSLHTLYLTKIDKKHFGLTLNKWKFQIKDSIKLSIIPILFLLGVKWILIEHDPVKFGSQIIDAFKIVGTHGLLYLLIPTIIYALFCPLQEFLARGVLQGPLLLLFREKRGNLNAVLLSNAVFGALHAVNSPQLAIISFFPGLFWGWMYLRHRSILGVSVSHIIIGTAFFFIGFGSL